MRVVASGQSNTDPFEGSVAIVSEHFLNRTKNCADYLLRILWKRDHLLRQDLSTQIGHPQCGLRRMYVKSEHTAQAIEVEKGWLPSPAAISSRTFKNPALRDQLFDDDRHGA